MANQSHAANMTQGSIWKLMVRFAIPIFLGNLFQQFYNVADTFIVGNVLGTEAMAAVGSSGNLIFMLIGFFQGVFVGAGVVVSRFWGARDHENVSIAVHTSVAFAIVAGLVLTLVGVLLTPTILDWMHTPADVLPNSIEYFRVYFGGVIFAVLYNAVNGIFQAVGDSRHPLYFLIISAMLNVALDLLFVGVLGMGVGGAAFATVISQAVSAFLGLRKLMKATESYRLIPRKIRFNGRMLQKVLYIGIPSGLQNAIFALANLFIQRGVNTFSATMVAGNSAATNADALVYDVMQAFYTACGSFIGQNYGAGKKDRIRRTFLISTAYAFGAGLLLGLGLLLFGRPFLSLFTTDPQVMDAGMYRLTVMSVSYCVSAFMDGSIAASRGLGKSAVPMVIVILGSCVFRIIWVYTVFAWFGTITSLYLLYVFSWTITAAAEIIYFIRIYRQATADLAAA